MKHFDTGSLVPGCDRTIRAETEAEIIMRAANYYREMLGEDAVKPSTIEEIKSRIVDEDAATA